MKPLPVALAALALGLSACTTSAAPALKPAAEVRSSIPPPATGPAETTPAETPPAEAEPPCRRPAVRACVDLSTKQAWLMDGGEVEFGPVPVSHGGPGYRTPTGTFPVAWKDKEHTSSIYGSPMPFSVFFATGGIAFHQGDVHSSSHGCVRLTRADAAKFFRHLHVGDLVQVVR